MPVQYHVINYLRKCCASAAFSTKPITQEVASWYWCINSAISQHHWCKCPRSCSLHLTSFNPGNQKAPPWWMDWQNVHLCMISKKHLWQWQEKRRKGGATTHTWHSISCFVITAEGKKCSPHSAFNTLKTESLGWKAHGSFGGHGIGCNVTWGTSCSSPTLTCIAGTSRHDFQYAFIVPLPLSAIYHCRWKLPIVFPPILYPSLLILASASRIQLAPSYVDSAFFSTLHRCPWCIYWPGSGGLLY